MGVRRKHMFDHSNCGIGAIANLDGAYSHEIIEQGMTLLKALSHRGGTSKDGTGDGCGILLQIPKHFYHKKYGISGPFAVMMAFLPKEIEDRKVAVDSIYEAVHHFNMKVIKEIEVPVDSTFLTPTAKKTEPIPTQFIFDMTNYDEAMLYKLRRRIEQHFKDAKLSDRACYILSCSSQTIVYKGLLRPEELPNYYLDLKDEDFTSNFCIVHQRFSTNTKPSWNLAQPFRYLAHNGEINTVSGNIKWSNARVGLATHQEVYPICNERHSDSANLDRTLEALLHENFELEDAVTRLLPKAYEQDARLSDDLKAYYEYSGLKQEAWDGPAGVIVCDGHKLIATLDRNGLRPFRYIQTENQIILASEIGVLNTPLEDIKVASRIQASEILCVDLDTQTITTDADIKAVLATQQPYREWLSEKVIKPSATHNFCSDIQNFEENEKKFAYTKAEYLQELKSLVETGKEAIGSFPYTAALNLLQDRPQLFFDFFKQNFAQVTNPPLDSIREKSVFSLTSSLTSVTSLHDGKLDFPVYEFSTPLITSDQFEAILNEKQFNPAIISLACQTTLRESIEIFKANIKKAVNEGTKVIILDQEAAGKVIPSLMATTVAHDVLVDLGKRLEVRLVVKSADARLPIHHAMLIAYGADVIFPYFCYEYIARQVENKDEALSTYIKGCDAALLKLMAKMGIATIASYRGSKVFEVVGLDEEVTSLFTTKASIFGGKSFEDLDTNLLGEGLDLNKVNEYQNMDSTFMNHAYSKKFIKDIKAAVAANDYETFKAIMEAERNRKINLRDCLELQSETQLPLEEVQSEEEIVRQFVASAMSYGALSIEAHRTIARAMNELGAASNSGEGGELVERFGTITASKVKQVASGRFGVTYDYLRSAQEIQIKMAQGAKPGEGGHLPKSKVDEHIARVRYAKQGVDLISPPPHHDIYSIEDLAQLIYDLQTTNPSATVSVKLASLANVGTIANGVVKAGAKKVVISGFNGGTGASPKSSLKYTGLPWEYGLFQTHKSLLENDVRHETLIQVDGQIKSGYDVVLGSILGADEFGFGTMCLVMVDCIGCKQCHTGKCPAGITTQNETLRSRLKEDPTMLKTYMTFVARQTRELMANLGVRTLAELRGRTELIQIPTENAYHLKLDWLESLPVTQEMNVVNPTLNAVNLSTNEVNTIDTSLRTLGVQFVSEEARTFKTYGYAGQSFGALMNESVELIHTGYANDYVGKGLSGGHITVKADETTRKKADQDPTYTNHHLIAGNTILYGATSGTCYLEGRVGERFAVRNSGATAVNHGMGVHACEYMTGGVVVSLGSVQANVGAGMTGGLLYLYKAKYLNEKLNESYVKAFDMKNLHIEILKEILVDYVAKTNNQLATQILNNFEHEVLNFTLVTSADYYQLEL